MPARDFEDEKAWKGALKSVGLTNQRHVRIATEAALLGSIIEHGTTNLDLVIISDDAGQFDVLLHGLCWIHAERSIKKLAGFNDAQREALKTTRERVWAFYRDLKDYKQAPDPEKKAALDKRFDEIFAAKTWYDALASVKKTCRKLGVGFWDYLNDRVSGVNSIPWLPDLMKQRLAASLQ
ncbi:hypothetical protein ACFL2Q_14470 [Thermodesulfobacteriota bacterium]